MNLYYQLNMKKNKNNIISDWIAEHGNPEIDIMVKHN
jgi:hypothetical protein